MGRDTFATATPAPKSGWAKMTGNFRGMMAPEFLNKQLALIR
jgi:hypothetical protein